MMWKPSPSICLCIAATVFPPMVIANARAEGTAATPPQQEDARKHFEQGVALFEEGNFDGALAELKAARKLGGGAAVLYNLGLTYQALFRYAEAVEALRQYLVVAEQQQRLDAGRKTAVLQLIDEMESLLGTVVVRVSPAEAQVIVDGRPVQLGTGNRLRLATGTHTLEASAPGFSPARRDVLVAGGETVEVSLPLQATAAAPFEATRVAAPSPGRLRVVSREPQTHVTIDQVEVGIAPIDVAVLPGQRLLELSERHHAPARLLIHIEPNRTLHVDVTGTKPKFDATERPQSVAGAWWFWGIVSGTTALLAGAWLTAAAGG